MVLWGVQAWRLDLEYCVGCANWALFVKHIALALFQLSWCLPNNADEFHVWALSFWSLYLLNNSVLIIADNADDEHIATVMMLKLTDDRWWSPMILKLADDGWWSAQWPRGESCQRWSSVARWSITVGRSVHGCAEWSAHASNNCCWSFDHLSYVCRSSDFFLVIIPCFCTWHSLCCCKNWSAVEVLFSKHILLYSSMAYNVVSFK